MTRRELPVLVSDKSNRKTWPTEPYYPEENIGGQVGCVWDTLP